ncbi:MAG: UvrB/UvrC motif-containing protein, partial [Erysipelotrichaceae bacterium]|nr:UvrB/UvrC motif-containing protein [Erysipelotrichaceae bacterium]
LERSEIIHDLREGKYDVLVGINLLREGLDIPEVSLIAILDADKEGFLRSSRSLIQTIGRAARNVHGRVIMYADQITESMQQAIDETNRRRSIQIEYNEKNNITPKSIVKEISEVIHSKETREMAKKYREKHRHTKAEKEKMMASIEQEMKQAAKLLNFERAAELRDILYELRDED